MSDIDYLREYMQSEMPGAKIEDVHVVVMRMFVTAMNTGVYNLDIRWKKLALNSSGVTFVWRPHVRGLSTFDYNHLTRLVLLAHERLIRVDLEPAAPGYFRVILHQRVPFTGSESGTKYHPNLDQAIARLHARSPWLTDVVEVVPA